VLDANVFMHTGKRPKDEKARPELPADLESTMPPWLRQAAHLENVREANVAERHARHISTLPLAVQKDFADLRAAKMKRGPG
jgi:hypothetical protein